MQDPYLYTIILIFISCCCQCFQKTNVFFLEIWALLKIFQEFFKILSENSKYKNLQFLLILKTFHILGKIWNLQHWGIHPGGPPGKFFAWWTLFPLSLFTILTFTTCIYENIWQNERQAWNHRAKRRPSRKWQHWAALLCSRCPFYTAGHHFRKLALWCTMQTF